MNTPVRLYCFPYAGGSARAYRELRLLLGDRVDLVALEVPGRDSRRRIPLPGTLNELVADLARQISAHGPGGCALYGHSFGGLLAYETGRLLARSSHPPPRALLVSGSRPPQLGPKFALVHRFPDQALLGALGMLGGVPEEVLCDPDAVGYFASQVRNDYRLYEQYRHSRPGELLDCPITVITGADDPVTSATDADVWGRVTTGPVTAVELPGAAHFFLETHARELAAAVMEALDPVPMSEVSDAQWCAAMARLPAATSVLTALVDGWPRAFPAGSVCVLSQDPPLVLVCAGQDALAVGRRFLVNMPVVANRPSAERLLVPCELGLPGLADAQVRLACTRERVLPCGDDVVLVGRVVAAGCSASRTLEER